MKTSLSIYIVAAHMDVNCSVSVDISVWSAKNKDGVRKRRNGRRKEEIIRGEFHYF